LWVQTSAEASLRHWADAAVANSLLRCEQEQRRQWQKLCGQKLSLSVVNVSAAVQSAHGMVGATGIVPAVKRLLLKGPKAAASPGPSTKTRKIRLPFGKALQKQHHKIENMFDRLTD
jgi:hypothetical protein